MTCLFSAWASRFDSILLSLNDGLTTKPKRKRRESRNVGEGDLDSRLTFVVHQESHPVDFEQHLAVFLLRIVGTTSVEPTSDLNDKPQSTALQQTAIRNFEASQFRNDPNP